MTVPVFGKIVPVQGGMLTLIGRRLGLGAAEIVENAKKRIHVETREEDACETEYEYFRAKDLRSTQTANKERLSEPDGGDSQQA